MEPVGGLEESGQVGMLSSIDDLFVGIFALLLAYRSVGWDIVRIYVHYVNIPSICQLARAVVAPLMLRAGGFCPHVCVDLFLAN